VQVLKQRILQEVRINPSGLLLRLFSRTHKDKVSALPVSNVLLTQWCYGTT
jgi:hypothetical protein